MILSRLKEYSFCLLCDWNNIPNDSPDKARLAFALEKTMDIVINGVDPTVPIMDNNWNGLRKTGPDYPPKKKTKTR